MHEEERERQAQRPAPAIEAPEPREDGVADLQRSMGNRAFGDALASPGAGILPDGRAHPHVEDMIARSRGGGGTLPATVSERVGGALGDDLGDVRVHADDRADALAKSVQARAFTVGSDVFFAKGEYRPGTGDGDRLLAHELTHVTQQRGAPTSGPLVVSEPGEPLERAADEAADAIG